MVVPRQPLRLMASPFPATSDHAGATSRVTNGLTPDGTTSVQTGSPSEERNSYAVAAVADLTDRSLHAALARFTGGLSSAALMQVIPTGRSILRLRRANACSLSTRQPARRSVSAVMPFAAR